MDNCYSKIKNTHESIEYGKSYNFWNVDRGDEL